MLLISDLDSRDQRLLMGYHQLPNIHLVVCTASMSGCLDSNMLTIQGPTNMWKILTNFEARSNCFPLLHSLGSLTNFGPININVRWTCFHDKDGNHVVQNPELLHKAVITISGSQIPQSHSQYETMFKWIPHGGSLLTNQMMDFLEHIPKHSRIHSQII